MRAVDVEAWRDGIDVIKTTYGWQRCVPLTSRPGISPGAGVLEPFHHARAGKEAMEGSARAPVGAQSQPGPHGTPARGDSNTQFWNAVARVCREGHVFRGEAFPTSPRRSSGSPKETLFCARWGGRSSVWAGWVPLAPTFGPILAPFYPRRQKNNKMVKKPGISNGYAHIFGDNMPFFYSKYGGRHSRYHAAQ